LPDSDSIPSGIRPGHEFNEGIVCHDNGHGLEIGRGLTPICESGGIKGLGFKIMKGRHPDEATGGKSCFGNKYAEPGKVRSKIRRVRKNYDPLTKRPRRVE